MTGVIFLLILSLVELSGMLQAHAAPALDVGRSLHYRFNVDGTLHETGSMSESSSPYFWLNSGGKLILKGGTGKTIQDSLPALDPWRVLYAATNALDTGNGYEPQNLFRLVTRSDWNNVEESVRFKITDVNLTDTPNRDGYSGILLMSRYRDGNNLYYAGIRMDGEAVIKKKYQGTYYTLASKKGVFPGAYDKDSNPNLIPEEVWMGIKSITKTNSDGSVRIELWLDPSDTGKWEQLIATTDEPGEYGSGVVKGPAHTGIRTDYLDVIFDDYRVKEL